MYYKYIYIYNFLIYIYIYDVNIYMMYIYILYVYDITKYDFSCSLGFCLGKVPVYGSLSTPGLFFFLLPREPKINTKNGAHHGQSTLSFGYLEHL